MRVPRTPWQGGSPRCIPQRPERTPEGVAGAVCPRPPEDIYSRYDDMSDRATAPTKAKHGSETRKTSARAVLKCTPEQRAEIESRAEKAGLSVSGYLRALVFGKDAPQPRAAKRVKLTADMEELRQLLYELRKIGGNLNQIAHHLNRGEETPPEIINAALAEHIAAARLTVAALSGEKP